MVKLVNAVLELKNKTLLLKLFILEALACVGKCSYEGLGPQMLPKLNFRTRDFAKLVYLIFPQSEHKD